MSVNYPWDVSDLPSYDAGGRTCAPDPRQALMDLHESLCDRARQLAAKKNQDYAAGDDPFANFRLCEEAGICSAEEGVIIRMLDKIRRLASLCRQEAHVTDESFLDSVLDLINYAVILQALRGDSCE